MKKKIFGDRYDFSIELIKNGKFYFEIWAKFKNTNQISPITNLNCILSCFSSVLEIPYNYDETTWVIYNTKEANKIFITTKKIFCSKYFIKYLELKLDEDREIGGWNSKYKF